jgi:hypothetical protein
MTQMADAADGNCELVGWPVILAKPEDADGQRMDLTVSVIDEDGLTADASISVQPHIPPLEG